MTCIDYRRSLSRVLDSTCCTRPTPRTMSRRAQVMSGDEWAAPPDCGLPVGASKTSPYRPWCSLMSSIQHDALKDLLTPLVHDMSDNPSDQSHPRPSRSRPTADSDGDTSVLMPNGSKRPKHPSFSHSHSHPRHRLVRWRGTIDSTAATCPNARERDRSLSDFSHAHRYNPRRRPHR